MTPTTTPNPEDLPLTAREETLVQWLLEHGKPDAAAFLPQLARARVASRCPCGCASINLAIGGSVPPPESTMRILADFRWRNAEGADSGIFAFARGNLLAGLEVWAMDGQDASRSLPDVEALRPVELGLEN